MGARLGCLISATCHDHTVAAQYGVRLLPMTSKKIGERFSQHVILTARRLAVLDISRNQRVRAATVRDLEER